MGHAGGTPCWLWGSPWVSRCPAAFLTPPCLSVLQAGKFNIIPTVINMGSGVALMGVVSTSPPPPLPSEHPRGRAAGTLPHGSCPSAPERTRTGEVSADGGEGRRALWDFTPLQQPPGGRDYLGFFPEPERLLPVALQLRGVLWDPAQPCLHFC